MALRWRWARRAAGSFTWTGAAAPDLVHDTFNGLLAFILPGSDAYSVAQGVSTADQGGVDTGVIEVLISTLDDTTPFLPDFSAQVAAILNGLAQAVDPTPGGPFVSPFANLAFAEKAAVFLVMDATPQFVPLAGVLPPFVAFLCYSGGGLRPADANADRAAARLAALPLPRRFRRPRRIPRLFPEPP